MFRYKPLPQDEAGAPPRKGAGVFIASSRIALDAGQHPVVALRSSDGGIGALLLVSDPGAGFAAKARESLDNAVQRFASGGWKRETLEAALVGGADNAKWKAGKWRETLTQLSLPPAEYDLNGQFYRKVYFEPRTGALSVFREEADPDHWNPAKAKLTLNDGVRAFSDNHAGGVVANATRFFREKITFRALRELVLPAHLEAAPGEPFHLWSAACSTGAEAYSYAMYLHRLIGRAGADVDFRVFATDINEKLVEGAKKGEYEIHKRDLEEYRPYFQRYGTLHGDVVRFSDELRRHLTFGVFDIRNIPRRRGFRMIVCANVFQYYNDDARGHFLENFASCAARPGYIYTGPVTPALLARTGLRHVPKYKLFEVD